jgi:hypothetical protein
MQFRQPGAIYKFKPEQAPTVSTVDLERKWGREFIDDEKTILDLLNTGSVIRKRLATPMATWLFRKEGEHNPNITGGTFRSLLRMGYLDHKRDVLPDFAEYEISKHGVRYLETLERKQNVVEHNEVADKLDNHFDLASNETLTLSEFPDTSHGIINILPLNSVLPIQSCNFFTLASGNHAMLAEFSSEKEMKRISRLLGLTTLHEQTEVQHKAPNVRCDFCHKMYFSGLVRKNVWLRYCRHTPKCKQEYQKLWNLFRSLNGRSPFAGDRKNSLATIDVVRE